MNTKTNAAVLVICRNSPYGSSQARDAIEFCLAASVYSVDVSILFMDDGVFQLLKDQNPSDLGLKSQQSLLQSLPLYDIERVYVDSQSLLSRGFDDADLIETAVLADQKNVEQLIRTATKVISF